MHQLSRPLTSASQPRLVIFDCDGVLVDSEPVGNRILTEHLCRAGIQMTEAQVQRVFRGCSAAMCIDKIGQWLTSPDQAAQFWQAMQAETLLALQGVKPVEGVALVLELMRRQDQAFCVASAGDFTKMHTTLGATGVLENFKPRLFSATDVKRSKPAPDLFLKAAQTMGFAPAQCVVIEDSLLGVQAAVAAGMQVFWYVAQRDMSAAELAQLENFDASLVTEFSRMADLVTLLGLTEGEGN
ncbi:HAD family phosphatase [Simiduia curdlanivorans]|uniref:HAD family hydrolase n=1 Tax=Simiduia curdlanivorans TaxID=1492769 RepID=A0ABV8V3S8_9GAMM|nr:HAD family phosphatase [Simiduia curdlanivorans]MDN3640851.1 HAD family phosphatase [Simiduia curdlanivorans]